MHILNPPAASYPDSTVAFDSKSKAVTLPKSVASITGLTVITGGIELSWGSCMLAFAVWGTLIGVSVVALGLWDQSVNQHSNISNLLALGLVVLAISLVVMGTVLARRYWRKGRKGVGRDEGKVMLVGERGRSCVKTVTV